MQNLAPAMGIYISIPFCRAKCSYCNFASGVYSADRMAAYVEKLTGEIREARERVGRWGGELPNEVDSIYFGGGTPSLLSSRYLEFILKVIREEFSATVSTEITLECAPDQLSDELLNSMPAMGFNRVSLGVQSFVDREATAVGRAHTRAIILNDINR
ncbi:MAG: radical SAM protein, partial [Acidobacteriota bacterium]